MGLRATSHLVNILFLSPVRSYMQKHAVKGIALPSEKIRWVCMRTCLLLTFAQSSLEIYRFPLGNAKLCIFYREGFSVILAGSSCLSFMSPLACLLHNIWSLSHKRKLTLFLAMTQQQPVTFYTVFSEPDTRAKQCRVLPIMHLKCTKGEGVGKQAVSFVSYTVPLNFLMDFWFSKYNCCKAS